MPDDLDQRLRANAKRNAPILKQEISRLKNESDRLYNVARDYIDQACRAWEAGAIEIGDRWRALADSADVERIPIFRRFARLETFTK